MTDPRYDPRFQRGWSGELPPPVAPAPAPPPRVLPPPGAAPEPRSTPRPQPVAPPEDEVPIDQDPDSEPESDRGPARNPYRIALVVLGVVLTSGGGGMLWQLAQPTTSQSASDYVLPQLENMVAPFIGLTGLLAIIAAVALGAFRRR